MIKTKKYKPRTEAQKIARRERDRKRREALRRTEKKAVVAKKKAPSCVKHNIAETHREKLAVSADTIKKQLISMIVIKEYICG